MRSLIKAVTLRVFQTEAGQQPAAVQGANSWGMASLAEMDSSWELWKSEWWVLQKLLAVGEVGTAPQMLDPLQPFKHKNHQLHSTEFILQSSLRFFPHC